MKILPWQGDEHAGSERVLYVDKPADGYVYLGIRSIYHKTIDPDEARGMAIALLVAADRAERQRAAEAARRAAESPKVNMTTGGMVPPEWMIS